VADSWDVLPADWPQVFTLSAPEAARYYKMEITELVPGADGVRTYEIESFTGPAIHEVRTQAEPLKAGDQVNLTGEVVGLESARSYHISVKPSTHLRSAGKLNCGRTRGCIQARPDGLSLWTYSCHAGTQR
jgi:hypothetical protein